MGWRRSGGARTVTWIVGPGEERPATKPPGAPYPGRRRDDHSKSHQRNKNTKKRRPKSRKVSPKSHIPKEVPPYRQRKFEELHTRGEQSRKKTIGKRGSSIKKSCHRALAGYTEKTYQKGSPEKVCIKKD